ncbi:hypothetical protein DBV08_00345 [Rhodococcus sp. KBW08]|nr:hypothetical protein DBV08_00345 [Rhodococcus sp. KBW08]
MGADGLVVVSVALAAPPTPSKIDAEDSAMTEKLFMLDRMATFSFVRRFAHVNVSKLGQKRLYLHAI